MANSDARVPKSADGQDSRPYFKAGIAELEAAFRLSGADANVLRQLEHELTFRATERATRLAAEVRAALNRFQGAAPPPRPPAAPKGPPAAAAGGRKPDARHAPPPKQDYDAGTWLPSPNEPPLIDLGPLISFVPTRAENEPRAILASWTALEALSPQTFRKPEDLASGDRRCVAALSSGLPWLQNELSRPKKQLFYQVVLGSIPMDSATQKLIEAFGEDQELSRRPQEKAAIAAVLVDRKGIPLEDNAVAISSFAWALPIAVRRELGALGAWPDVELRLVQALTVMLRRTDPDGKPVALDMPTIQAAFRWLVRQLGLTSDLAEPPAFALRIYHYFKAKSPPEVQLLNSFFMGDLTKASKLVASGAAPPGLRGYLGMDAPQNVADLLTAQHAVEEAVAPKRMPAARWPSPGGHPLILLQQAAVNLARQELRDNGGIVAVNGPPGTGKTTLLRDILAAAVLDRATAMATFEDPATAFTSAAKMQVGDAGFVQLYRLDARLKGHEVLVASSNNKAVENVSRELPAAGAVGRTRAELGFFKTVSDRLHAPADDKDEPPGDGPPELADTWGMIAAVLGNARNRAAFQQRFWWDKDRSFRLYLKAAKGDMVVEETRDPATGAIKRWTPSVVAVEKPPLPAAAKQNWSRARKRLLDLKAEVETELSKLEQLRQVCLALAASNKELPGFEAAAAAVAKRASNAEAEQRRLAADTKRLRTASYERQAAVTQSRATRPGFVARLFRSRGFKSWSTVHAGFVAAARSADLEANSAEDSETKAAAAAAKVRGEAAVAEQRFAAAQQTNRQHRQHVAAMRSVHGARVVDEEFFATRHETRHKVAPWVPDKVHRMREDLFVAAMDVHRAFIDAAAQKVMHNLGALMSVMSAGPPADAERRALLGDLWSTLFMAVPLVSTTFASVDRMLGALPPGSIGWLLIDEAGQALPQAAVGAIMRAKRTIDVGDPLQIPPVTSLPERLNQEVCRFFKVEVAVWAAPSASAQTLADKASRYQADYGSGLERRRVGIPLLVHRRCQEPMFGISNRIAYGGLMVHAAQAPEPGEVGKILGPSRWLDVDGDADSKWCPAEAEVVVSMLRKLADAGIKEPDIFIVTPFRIVAHELRRRLQEEHGLAARLGIDWREWTKDRVGTIHTVQGREADTVIVVLGAPKASQNGARAWAAGTPNILNVAVSRAKQNLYVVGSHGSWSGIAYAQELATLERDRISAGSYRSHDIKREG